MTINNRKNLITYFFNKLESLSINYAILHHCSDIFEVEHDIDFIVGINFEDMYKYVVDFCKINNTFLFNVYTIDRDIYRFDLVFFNENNVSELIELDCCCNGKGKDSLSLNASELLLSPRKFFVGKNYFWTLNKYYEYDYYIKKKAYKNEDIELYNDYLLDLKNNTDFQEIYNLYKYWMSYYRSIKYKLKKFSNIVYRLINRYKEKPSLVISFLGPDGSGKTTIIDFLLNNLHFRNSYYYHLKPIVQKSKTKVIIVDPHKSPVYSKPKSYLKVCYFFLQYNIGWIFNILPKKLSSSLVIFDRYYDDMLVDNKRYRYGGSINIAKIVRTLIPKVDIYFILTSDAKIIYERKQEVPFEELERQIDSYRSLNDGIRYLNIDVNRTPAKIFEEIANIIMVKMNERY